MNEPMRNIKGEPCSPFEPALAELVAHIQDISTANDKRFDASYAAGARTIIEVERGPKYTRIVQRHTGIHSQRSCYGFVRNQDGATLYAAGWKGPYLKGKNAVRGSIYDKGTWAQACNTYGVRTLR